MALPLPNLDDRTYADLMAEVRSRIPIECPAWTDHNPSDPGIILLELLAWVTETVLYRVNQVPDANQLTFLKLLNPPGWQPTADLQADLQTTLLDLRQRYRAVTAADYEHLLLERWPHPLNLPAHQNLRLTVTTPLARVHCLPTTQPTADSSGDLQSQPGHLTLVVMPQQPGDLAPSPSPQLLDDLAQWLAPCRLLTTHHHLIAPRYVRVNLAAELYLLEGANPVQVIESALAALQQFFAPLPEPPNPYWDGQGWPFGRAVYPSELYQLLDQLPGVDYVDRLQLHRADTAAAPAASGGLAPIELQAHELAQLNISPDTVGQMLTLKERRGNSWVAIAEDQLAGVVMAAPVALAMAEAGEIAPEQAATLPAASPVSAAGTVPPPLTPQSPSPLATPSPLAVVPSHSIQPNYLSYLPAYLQSDARLDQFLSVFKRMLSGATIPADSEPCPGVVTAHTPNPPSLERIISLAHTYFDPYRTPDEFLPWLAGWVALSLQDNWPTATKRRFIDEIAPLYRQRGTQTAMTQILQIYLESAGFKDVADKIKITEFADYPNFFQVSLTLTSPDPNLYWQQACIAKNIIDQEKPAHTYYALKIFVPTMRLGPGLILGRPPQGNTVLGNQEGG